jgi:hypothetical protein
MTDFMVPAEWTMTGESTVATEILDVTRRTLTLESASFARQIPGFDLRRLLRAVHRL